jgi:hypothetical protein
MGKPLPEFSREAKGRIPGHPLHPELGHGRGRDPVEGAIDFHGIKKLGQIG